MFMFLSEKILLLSADEPEMGMVGKVEDDGDVICIEEEPKMKKDEGVPGEIPMPMPIPIPRLPHIPKLEESESEKGRPFSIFHVDQHIVLLWYSKQKCTEVLFIVVIHVLFPFIGISHDILLVYKFCRNHHDQTRTIQLVHIYCIAVLLQHRLFRLKVFEIMG